MHGGMQVYYLQMRFQAMFQFLSCRIISEQTEPGQGAISHVDSFVQRRHKFKYRRGSIKTYNLNKHLNSTNSNHRKHLNINYLNRNICSVQVLDIMLKGM